MTTRRLTEPPHQGPAALERGPELFERGAQWGASPTEEPQPAWSLLQQDQGHRGEYFCWWVVSELKSWSNTMIFHILRIQYKIYQNNILNVWYYISFSPPERKKKLTNNCQGWTSWTRWTWTTTKLRSSDPDSLKVITFRKIRPALMRLMCSVRLKLTIFCDHWVLGAVDVLGKWYNWCTHSDWSWVISCQSVVDVVCSGMPRVTSLKLDYNKIKTIHDEAFYGLEGLSNS